MKIAIRLLPPRYRTDEAFADTLALLRTYGSAIDELTLFTEYWHHGYYPPEQFAEAAAVMKQRVRELKEAGFAEVGINMLATIGHFNEAWHVLPPLPYQPLVDYDGTVSASVACPSGEAFRTYIRNKYALVAQAAPDHVWVDDDIRLFMHGPVKFGCFCATCIGDFNRRTGGSHDAASLAAALNAAGANELREQWMDFRESVFSELMQLVKDTVREIHPEAKLGYMSVDNLAANRWMTDLDAVMGRPGGGFYSDAVPADMLTKILNVGHQIAAYPEQTTDIQYEHENFPYQRLTKSVRLFAAECAAILLNGANGILFNVLKQEPGTLDDYRPYLDRIARDRASWAAIAERSEGMDNVGFYCGWSASHAYRHEAEEGTWLQMPLGRQYLAPDPANALHELGIPFAFKRGSACGTILQGEMAQGYSNEELETMLAAGVVMDGRSLELLWERGLGEWCGVAIEAKHENGVMEQYTNDPLNGKYAGERRDGRMSSWPSTAYALKPIGNGVRTLSELIDFTGENRGTASALYQNERGGRVAVFGYMPWKNLGFAAKQSQLLGVCDWVAGGRMALLAAPSLKTVPYVRVSPDGRRGIAALMNASLDETGPFAFELRLPFDELSELSPTGEFVPVAADRVRAGEGAVAIQSESIQPWELRVFSFAAH